MIEAVTMYEGICDGCGATLGSDDYDALVFENEEDAKRECGFAGWEWVDGKLYCEDCIEKHFVYDEENDKYVRIRKQENGIQQSDLHND